MGFVMFKKYLLSILLLAIALPLCSMRRDVGLVDGGDRLVNFTELPQEVLIVILGFVCEKSNQPHVPAINIVLGHINFSLINKACKEAVYAKVRLPFFDGKLLNALMENQMRAIEHEGIRLFRRACGNDDEDLPSMRELPFMVTAVAVAVLVDDLALADKLLVLADRRAGELRRLISSDDDLSVSTPFAHLVESLGFKYMDSGEKFIGGFDCGDVFSSLSGIALIGEVPIFFSKGGLGEMLDYKFGEVDREVLAGINERVRRREAYRNSFEYKLRSFFSWLFDKCPRRE